MRHDDIFSPMRSLLVFIILVTSFAYAQDSILLSNDREGTSIYESKKNSRSIQRLLKKYAAADLIRSFKDALELQKDQKLCAYDLNTKLKNTLQASDPELAALIYFLRSEGEIDDVSARILLRAHEVNLTTVKEKDEEVIFIPRSEKLEDILKLIASFEKRFMKNNCFDEAFRTLFSEIQKLDKHIKDSDLEGLFYLAKKEGRIDEATYRSLEQGRLSDLHLGSLGLAAYYQKLTMLRTQYPLRDRNERSNFVTERTKKIKLTRRQKLFEYYSDLQIILMANLIKNLRQDLESPKMEIRITTREGEVKTRELKPMERFRASIRFLRVEMAALSLNTYFDGRTPEFMDLVVAAYEIGIIPAEEVDALAKLEEIWNPKKTFMEKASVWIQTFGSVSSIVIPPPYGFIPALALVIIEATTPKKKDPNTIDPTSVF